MYERRPLPLNNMATTTKKNTDVFFFMLNNIYIVPYFITTQTKAAATCSHWLIVQKLQKINYNNITVSEYQSLSTHTNQYINSIQLISMQNIQWMYT